MKYIIPDTTVAWIFFDIVFWVVVFLILHYYNSDDEPRIKEEPKKVIDEDESYNDFIDED